MAKESAPGALLEGRNPEDPQDGAHGGCRVRSSGRRRSRDGTDRYLPTNPFRRPDRDRGQTTQDFAVGVSIFLLVLAGTVAFLPNIFAPYDQNVGSVERQQAVRIADVLVADSPYAVQDASATLSYADLRTELAGSLLSDLRTQAGVPDRAFSVSIYTRPGLEPAAVYHAEGPFSPDGTSPASWSVVNSPGAPIERFDMEVKRHTLPSVGASSPFVVEIDGFTVELEKDGGQVVVTPSAGACSVSVPPSTTVRTIGLDFTTGTFEVTAENGDTDSCDVQTPIETNPAADHTVTFERGAGYPEGSYHLSLGAAPSGFTERDVFDSDPAFPETSIVKLDGHDELHDETSTWNGQPSVTVSRLVTFENTAPAAECKPVCELVVRVW